MSKETAASLRSTVDDISQDIGRVNISNDGIPAAVACVMSSREEDTVSEEKYTSCDQKLDNTSDVQSDMLLKEEDSDEGNSGDVDVSIYANCGKEGAINICNKCKQVTYCNAACKKKHKSKHKKGLRGTSQTCCKVARRRT